MTDCYRQASRIHDKGGLMRIEEIIVGAIRKTQDVSGYTQGCSKAISVAKGRREGRGKTRPS